MVFSAYVSGCLGVRCCRLALCKLSSPPLACSLASFSSSSSSIPPHSLIRYIFKHSQIPLTQFFSTHIFSISLQHQRHRQPQSLLLPFQTIYCIISPYVTKKHVHHDRFPLQDIYCKLNSSTLLTHPSSACTVAIYIGDLFSMGKGPKRKQHKKRLDQLSAATSYVAYWAKGSKLSFSSMGSSTTLSDWIPSDTSSLSSKPLIIDLHTHSNCSDGMLTPAQLVEKASVSGVQVLALTDHDTMAGIPAALETANRLGIRLIPGVEISAKVTAKTKSGFEEPVHILGYYSCCGPARWQELEAALARIREGRHHRAQSIISKLKLLKKPVTWESVVMMAGAGVAPGRLHIARALLEAGHVCSLREAFNKYLYDGGPAYAPGCELAAEDAVRLVCDTGGVAVLAHPWSLKDALPVVKRLKEVGLQAMEVYRGDGRANGFAVIAETFELLKLGGSDFHGRGDPDETKLGKVLLPLLAVHEFLQVAEPIWRFAVKELLEKFAEESFQITNEKLSGAKFFTGLESLKGDVVLDHSVEKEHHKVSLRLSPWLTEDDRQAVQEAATQLKLQIDMVVKDGREQCIVSRQIR